LTNINVLSQAAALTPASKLGDGLWQWVVRGASLPSEQLL